MYNPYKVMSNGEGSLYSLINNALVNTEIKTRGLFTSTHAYIQERLKNVYVDNNHSILLRNIGVSKDQSLERLIHSERINSPNPSKLEQLKQEVLGKQVSNLGKIDDGIKEAKLNSVIFNSLETSNTYDISERLKGIDLDTPIGELKVEFNQKLRDFLKPQSTNTSTNISERIKDAIQSNTTLLKSSNVEKTRDLIEDPNPISKITPIKPHKSQLDISLPSEIGRSLYNALDIDPDKLPKIKGVFGIEGSYNISKNEVRINQGVISRIEAGIGTDNDLVLLRHEMQHSIQRNTGMRSYSIMEGIREGVLGESLRSTTKAIGDTLRKQGMGVIGNAQFYKDIASTFAMEMDAYTAGKREGNTLRDIQRGITSTDSFRTPSYRTPPTELIESLYSNSTDSTFNLRNKNVQPLLWTAGIIGSSLLLGKGLDMHTIAQPFESLYYGVTGLITQDPFKERVSTENRLYTPNLEGTYRETIGGDKYVQVGRNPLHNIKHRDGYISTSQRESQQIKEGPNPYPLAISAGAFAGTYGLNTIRGVSGSKRLLNSGIVGGLTLLGTNIITSINRDDENSSNFVTPESIAGGAVALGIAWMGRALGIHMEGQLVPKGRSRTWVDKVINPHIFTSNVDPNTIKLKGASLPSGIDSFDYAIGKSPLGIGKKQWGRKWAPSISSALIGGTSAGISTLLSDKPEDVITSTVVGAMGGSFLGGYLLSYEEMFTKMRAPATGGILGLLGGMAIGHTLFGKRERPMSNEGSIPDVYSPLYNVLNPNEIRDSISSTGIRSNDGTVTPWLDTDAYGLHFRGLNLTEEEYKDLKIQGPLQRLRAFDNNLLKRSPYDDTRQFQRVGNIPSERPSGTPGTMDFINPMFVGYQSLFLTSTVGLLALGHLDERVERTQRAISSRSDITDAQRSKILSTQGIASVAQPFAHGFDMKSITSSRRAFSYIGMMGLTGGIIGMDLGAQNESTGLGTALGILGGSTIGFSIPALIKARNGEDAVKNWRPFSFAQGLDDLKQKEEIWKAQRNLSQVGGELLQDVSDTSLRTRGLLTLGLGFGLGAAAGTTLTGDPTTGTIIGGTAGLATGAYLASMHKRRVTSVRSALSTAGIDIASNTGKVLPSLVSYVKNEFINTLKGLTISLYPLSRVVYNMNEAQHSRQDEVYGKEHIDPLDPALRGRSDNPLANNYFFSPIKLLESPTSDTQVKEQRDLVRYYKSGARYGGEYVGTEDPGTIQLYDQNRIGEGFMEFLKNVDPGSAKGAFYSVSTDSEVLRLMSRASQKEGIITSYAQLKLNPFSDPFTGEAVGEQSGRELSQYFGGYVLDTLRKEGVGAGLNAFFTGNLYSWINTASTALGFGPLIKHEEQAGGKGIYLDRGVAAVEGAIHQSSKSIPTFLNTLAVSAEAPIVSLWKRHNDPERQRLLAQDPTSFSTGGVNPTLGGIVGAGLGGFAGSILGRDLGGRLKGGIAGALIGGGIGAAAGISSIMKLLPGMGNMGDSSIFHTKFGGQSEYIIHSKMIMGTIDGEKVAYVSTGNIGAMYKAYKGEIDQFNYGMFISDRSKYGAEIIHDLEVAYDAVKTSRPGQDLDLSKMRGDSVVVGGPVAGTERDSKKQWRDFISKATREKEDILWTSAYSQGAGTTDLLYEHLNQGNNVTIVMQNPYGAKGGGYREGTQKMLIDLLHKSIELKRQKDSGEDVGQLKVIINPSFSEALQHSKMMVAGDDIWLGSHNFSNNSFNKVFEIALKIQNQKGLAESLKSSILGASGKYGFTDITDLFSRVMESGQTLSDFEKMLASKDFNDALQRASDMTSFEELNISGQFFPMFRDTEEGGTLLINPKMGASYFHSRSLYNNLQRQGRAYHRVINEQDAGVATSLYKIAYIAKINEKARNEGVLSPTYSDLGYIPGIVQAYDKELYTQGLGSVLNERVFMPLGMGRLYQDEVGFLPSLMGGIGQVLDRTYLFYSGAQNIQGLTSNYADINAKSNKHKERATPTGLFESLLGEGTFLIQSSAQALIFYMTIGEPLNLLLSESFKSSTEALIHESLSGDHREFNNPLNRVKRQYLLGQGLSSTNPIGTKLNVLDTINRMKQLDSSFFGAANFSPTIYHASSILLRTRSASLLEDVMKPFLLEVFNPYSKNDLASQRGFISMIDEFINEVGKPIELKPVYNATQEAHVKETINKRNSLLHYIGEISQGNNLTAGFAPINRVDDAIAYKHSRELLLGKIKGFINQHGLGVTSNITNGSLGELEELLRGLVASTSNNDTLRDELYRTITDPSTSPRNIELSERRAGRVYDYELTTEGVLVNSINFQISNEGVDRASAVALRLQGILDEIPLNPLYWGAFNKYDWAQKMSGETTQGYKRVITESGIVIPKVRTIGDILSFSELTERVRDITFGKGGVSEHFIRAQVQSQYDWLQEVRSTQGQQTGGTISGEERLDIIAAGLSSKIKATTDQIHTFWNATTGFGLEAGKRAIDRYKLIMGGPLGLGNGGIMRSSIALKNFEFHLLTLLPESNNPALKGIQWGDDPQNLANAIKSAESAAKDIWNKRGTIPVDEFINSYGLFTNEDEFINNYVNRNLYRHAEDIDPLTRQINAIDEYAIKQLRVVHDVMESVTQRAIGSRTGTGPLSNVMDGDLWMEAHERLRAETMGQFRMGLLNEKELQRRLLKISHGLGSDATGKVTKRKGITTALSLVSIFSIFGDQLMQNTSGVSLSTQLGYALFMGGGPIGRLLGNKEGELKVNTEFNADRVLPDLPFLGRTGTVIATNLALLGAASVLGTASLRSEAVSYGFTLDKLISRIKTQKANGTPFGVDLEYMVDEVGPFTPGTTPGKQAKYLSDHLGINSMTSAQLKGELAAAENMKLVFNIGNDKFSFNTRLQGNQVAFRSMKVGGNLWFNTAMSYLALSFGTSALTKGVSSMMNYMRDTTSTLDPMAYGLLGSIALGMGTRKFGMGLAGLIGGTALGYLSNALGVNFLSIGSKGSLTDNVQSTIIGQLSAFRHSVRGNLGGASRAELMAAILGEGLENKFSILRQDKPAKETKVIAKQVTFPLVQFFATSKVVGERTDASGRVLNRGDRYFYLGIQGPPITGMSMNLSLPFKIMGPGRPNEPTKGGPLGLAINEETDILDYLYQVSMITTSFGLLGNAFKGLGHLTNIKGQRGLASNPFYSLGKGITSISKSLQDIMLILPRSITKAGMYLSTADLQSLSEVTNAKKLYEASNLIPSWEKKLGSVKNIPLLAAKAMAVYMIGNTAGRLAFSMNAESASDIEANADSAALYTGLAMTGTFIGFSLLKPRVRATNSAFVGALGSNIRKATDLINAPRLSGIRRFGFASTLFTSAAALMTDSNFGLFQGMDEGYAKQREDYLDSHQLLVSMGYGITMGGIATSIGGMGSSSADIVDQYRDALGKSGPTNLVNKMFSFIRMERLSDEAEQVYQYIRTKGNFIDKNYKLVEVIDPNGFNVTPEFHMKQIKDMFDSEGFTSMKQALNSSRAEEIISHMRGTRGKYIDRALAPDRIYNRLLKGPVGLTVATAFGAGILHTINPDIFNADTFYSWLQGEGVYAKGEDSKNLGIRNVIADITRLMTFTDRSIDSGIELDKVFRSGQTYGGKNFAVTKEKLLLSRGGFGEELNKTIQGLSELLILDDVNAFISGPGGFGITLRRGEEGTVLTSYFQLQASGTDISSAAYSMASRFLFKSLSQNTNEFSFEVQNAMKGLDAYMRAGIDPPKAMVRKAALGILLSTSSLQPRERARRVSRMDSLGEGALSNASIALALEARNTLSRNLAYQPSESLVSRMYLDAMTTSHRNLDNLLRNTISPLGASQEGIGTGKDLSSYLFGDPFQITSRKVNVSNIKFFVSDSSKKRGQRVKGSKSGQGDMYNEYSNLHLDTYIGEDEDLLFSPLIQRLNATINTLPQPLPMIVYGGLLVGIPLYVMPMFLGGRKIQAEMTEQGLEAMSQSSERWFTSVNPADNDQVTGAWRLRKSYPLPGQGKQVISAGENVPIIYKGNYQMQINPIAGMHQGVTTSLSEELGRLQAQLDEGRMRLDPNDPRRIAHLNEVLNSGDVVSQLKQTIHGSILDSAITTGGTTPNIVNQLSGLQTSNISSEFQLDPNKSLKENLFNAKKAQDRIKPTGSAYSSAARNEIDNMVSTLENLYSAHISNTGYIDNVSNQLTNVYMQHMDRVIDKYVDTLLNSTINIDSNTARSLYTNMGIPSDQVDAYINSRYKRGEIKTIKVKTAAMFIPGLSVDTLLSIESEADFYNAIQNMGPDSEYVQRLGIDDQGNIDMRKALKQRARASIMDEMQKVVSQLNLNPKDFVEVLGTGELGNPDFQAKMITHKLMLSLHGGKGLGDDGFFSIMRHHWGGLSTQPPEGVKRTLSNAMKGLVSKVWGSRSNYMTVGEQSANTITSAVNKPRRITPSVSPMKGMEDSEDMKLFIQQLVDHNTNRVGGMAKYSKGIFEMLGYLGFGIDTLEALNIYGSFAYLGGVYNNGNATTAQRRLASRVVGTSLAMYAGGIAVNLLSMGAMSVGSLLAAQFGLPLIAMGALATAAIAGIGLLSTPKDAKKSIVRSWDKAWNSTIDFWSDVTYNIAEGTQAMGMGGRGTAAVLGGIGGGLAGIGLGLGVVGFMTSLTLLTGIAALAAPAGIIAASALTLGAIGGALGFIAPKGIGNLTSGILKGLNEFRIGGVPIFNLFINTTDEAQRQLLEGISQPSSGLTEGGSPFLVGTVNDAIAQDYKKFLYGSKDITGRDASSMFISSTIYGRAPSTTNAVINKFGDFMNIRPDGLIDPSIQRELNIRGQAFNHSIIGAYTWRTMLTTSTNINAIRRAQSSTPSGAYINKSQSDVDVIMSQSNSVIIPNYSMMNTPNVRTDTYSSGASDFIGGIKDQIERTKVALANTKQPLNVELHNSAMDNTTASSRDIAATYNINENPLHYRTSLNESNKGSQVSLGFSTESDTIASINQMPYSN